MCVCVYVCVCVCCVFAFILTAQIPTGYIKATDKTTGRFVGYFGECGISTVYYLWNAYVFAYYDDVDVPGNPIFTPDDSYKKRDDGDGKKTRDGDYDNKRKRAADDDVEKRSDDVRGHDDVEKRISKTPDYLDDCMILQLVDE